jgi:peroxiredoxin
MSAESTDTLKIGDQAPPFSLIAANQPVTVTLQGVLKRGPAIIEFLRGTW